MTVTQKLRIATEALKKIAALTDQESNVTLMRTGKHSGFDEPGSVQTAREALREMHVAFLLEVSDDLEVQP